MRFPLVIFLVLGSFTAFAQWPDDINFIGFTYKKPIGDTLFRNPNDKDSLSKFFKLTNAHSLPVTIKSGKAEIGLSCNEFIGLCLNASKHTKVTIKTRLKNKAGDTGSWRFEIDIAQRLNDQVRKLDKNQTDYWLYRTKRKDADQAAKDQVKDVLILNLGEELIRNFIEPPSTDMACCPEKYTSDARQEAIRKICELLSIQGGIEIEIDNPGKESTTYTNSVAFFDPVQMQRRNEKLGSLDAVDYIVVEEQTTKNNKPEVIWNKGTYYKQIIDSRGSVMVRFNLDELREVYDFSGTMSLTATINDGDPIPIEGFSVIGEDYSKVGMASQAPYDFALTFLTALDDIYRLTTKDPTFAGLNSNLNGGPYNARIHKWLLTDNINNELYESIKKRLNARSTASATTPSRWSVTLTTEQAKIVTKFSKSKFYNSITLATSINSPIADILDQLNNDKYVYEDSVQQKKAVLTDYLVSALNQLKATDPQLNDTDTIAIGFQLREFFHAANRDELRVRYYNAINTRQAINIKDFASLVDGLNNTNNNVKSIAVFLRDDYVAQMDFAIRHLEKIDDYFDKFLNTDEKAFAAILSQVTKDAFALQHTSETIKENRSRLIALRDELTLIISKITEQPQDSLSPEIKAEIDDKVQRFETEMKRFIKTFLDLLRFEKDEFEKARRNYNADHPSFEKQEFMKAWAQQLAVNAARYIYSNLKTGVIRLSARTIQDDDKLSIYVIKFKPSGEKEQPELVAEFRLRKTGWNRSITDSFLLINRNGAATGERFKGAYGGSVMWTYTSGEKPDFLQRLEPSIGINVAYVDFDPNQTIEVGVGALVGFWRNTIFLGWGRNLHVKENPTYFSIGFSFANLIGHFPNNKKD